MTPIQALLKALAKFTGRHILRRTGVFGIYGSFKKVTGKNLTKGEMLKKLTTSVIKKNVLKQLGPMNFFIDIFKKNGGVKYALKQYGWQKLTPMAIKKVYYLYQNYEGIMKDAKREIWKPLRLNSKHSPKWKIEQIEEIINSRTPKSFKKKLLDDWFRFKVVSPNSHNFNRTNYAWNPATGQLQCSIRSGGGKRIVHHYTHYGFEIKMIKKMVMTTDYGRLIYWTYYKKSKKNKI